MVQSIRWPRKLLIQFSTGVAAVLTNCSPNFPAPIDWNITMSDRGGLGRRDTGKIPGGPPGPVILTH